MLTDKTIVLGITGSIAAYKGADIASKLTQAGAVVEAIMTEAATRFIAPLTLRSITGRPVVTDMFHMESEYKIDHIALAEAADAIVIAPATANIIAKLAYGIADDELTCTVLATRAPIIIAPAMNAAMYHNPVTQQNLARLKTRGFTVVGPEHGYLACDQVGMGRLADSDKIIDAIEKVLNRRQDLKGRRIAVTAGGTREPIDPARHIGNRSSGKMGYALAEAARDRGAEVKLVTAPTSLPHPEGMEVIPVETAAEMKKAVAEALKDADALIMAAAVTDYRPKSTSATKLKKDNPSLTLELARTPDILAGAKGKFIKVGFAAESDNIVANAKKKLKQKNLDLIAANDITAADSGFDVDTNKITLIDRQGKEEDLPLMSKREAAEKVLDRVVGLLGKRREGVKKGD